MIAVRDGNARARGRRNRAAHARHHVVADARRLERLGFFRPAPDDVLVAAPANPAMNRTGPGSPDGPECLLAPPTQGGLFG